MGQGLGGVGFGVEEIDSYLKNNMQKMSHDVMMTSHVDDV